MSREKSKNLNTFIQELEAKIRTLENEYAALENQFEKTLLNNMITESSNWHNNIISFIENSLEKISILINLPFCCCCKIDADRIVPVFAYPKFKGDIEKSVDIHIASKILKEIEVMGRVYNYDGIEDIKIKLNKANNGKYFKKVLVVRFKTTVPIHY